MTYIIEHSNKELSSFEEAVLKILKGDLNINHILINYQLDDKFELDFYLPSYGYAIEANGLYYHTNQFGRGKFYHIDKYNYCKNRNIKLINLFGDYFKDIDRIIFLLKWKLGLLEFKDINNINSIVLNTMNCSKINQKNILENKYLKYNIHKFKVMNYHILNINNIEHSVCGFTIKDNICKIYRFNNIYNKNNNYYKDSLLIIIYMLFNKYKDINQINVNVDNNFFSEELFIKNSFKLIDESGPRKQLINIFNTDRINLKTNKVSYRQRKYEIWDCGAKNYSITKEEFKELEIFNNLERIRRI